jgi:hypothetical protein
MRGYHGGEIVDLLAGGSHGWKPVDETVLVPPVTREKIARNAAVISACAIGIGKAVMRPDAFQRRRSHRAKKPLQHTVIRLADATNIAVTPGLPCDPLDHVMHILVIVPAEKLEVPAGATTAANVHVHVRVTLLDVEFDRPGLTPQELRAGRKYVVVEAIRRGCEQGGKAPAAFRRVDRDANLYAIAHCNHCHVWGRRCTHYAFSSVPTLSEGVENRLPAAPK